MRKFQVIFVLLVFFAIHTLHSQVENFNGQLSGGTNIRSVQSEYFLIIFPEQCLKSAKELREKADGICKKICSQMNMTCPFKDMPVVITQSTDVYNAYFSNASYNHIVLFDAAAQENLSLYSDTLLSTFEHELTHALTVNQKSQKLRHRLCNMIYWGDFVETPSMIKEGAAVAQESRDGEGRLNSPFFLHTIAQAKLSGEFPSWADVLGSRDIYPAGSSAYIFGSSFTKWLQDKYGMQKYADFWWEIINNFHISFRGGFQKVYGVNLNAAWKEFAKSIQVPSINSNPLQEEFVGDFFREGSNGSAKGSAGDAKKKSSKESSKFSAKNTSGYRYTNLSPCKKGFAYIEAQTSSVYFCQLNKDGSFAKPKKLFSQNGIDSISLSPDGAFLAVSYYSYNSMNVKTKVKFFNMESKEWTFIDETGLRDATVLIIGKQGPATEYAFAAVKTMGQESFIKTYRIKDGHAVEDKLVNLPDRDAVFCLCGGSGGNIAFLCKQGLEWKIKNLFVYGKNSGSGIEYSLGAKTELRSLSFYYGKKALSGSSLGEIPYGQESLALSFATKGSFPRLCIIEDSTAYMQSTDLSGGVYSPVCLGEKTVYSAHFYTDSKLFLMQTEKVPMQGFGAGKRIAYASIDAAGRKEKLAGKKSKGKEGQEAAQGAVQDAEYADFLADAKPYKNMFQKKLSVLPFSYVPQYDNNGALSNTIIFPGLMGIFSTPWDNEILSLSTGWDVFSKCGGFAAKLQGGSMAQTQFFVYNEEAAITYDTSGFRQFSNSISISNTVHVGKTGSITATERNLLVDGKQKISSNSDYDFSLFGVDESGIFASTKLEDSDNHSIFSVQNALSLEYSNIHKTGPGYWNSSGFSFKTVYANKYLRDKATENSFSNSQLFPSATIRIGRLIPIDCRQGFTYNLPVSLSGSLCYNATSLFKVSAEGVLFASEIQKGLTPVPLYFKRFALTGGYSVRMWHPNGDMEIFRIANAFKEADWDMIEDSLSITASIYSMINTGVLASPSIMHRASLSFRYHPHRFNGREKYVIGIGSSFFF